ncbi:signal recognition particle receptor subunit beta [Kwoniella mangroviensis CBS 8886]|uniref:hypothetical protein n=1 Tax=Kwoniella mangroviensis CBS 8507 TaxID=1296122 RepID=UPI00080D6D0E|nr:signal recognition particle receptor subunit beta [Kwoniella mangroviensis CBS 8507]OCF65873.1 signal recognition particle receptor subunit beta [Kwoniella mangroviensis CBS 8507]OCF72049.1 signal recognition particle receptor subunit beta [Kwoniella mangroviensis CBS 8886]
MSSPPGKVVSTDTATTPEVEPLSSLLAHPLLQDSKFVAAAGGLVVLLIFLSLFRTGKKSSRRSGPASVLLVGPSDSGKTSLFTKLVHDTYIQTHTSIQPSITTFRFNSPYEDGQTKPIRLIDLPGHPRLKDELKKYVKEASAVVFVVDIQALVRNSAAVAEDLAPILVTLSNQSITAQSEPTKVLVLAHKSDVLTRSSSNEIPESSITTARERVKSILTREMDRLKATRTKSGAGGKIESMGKVAGTSSSGFFAKLFGGGTSGVGLEGEDEGEDESLIWGGKGGFSWDDVEGVEITFGASGLGPVGAKKEEKEGNGLNEVKSFIWDV